MPLNPAWGETPFALQSVQIIWSKLQFVCFPVVTASSTLHTKYKSLTCRNACILHQKKLLILRGNLHKPYKKPQLATKRFRLVCQSPEGEEVNKFLIKGLVATCTTKPHKLLTFFVYPAAPSTQYPLVQRYAWKEIRQTIPTQQAIYCQQRIFNSATKHWHSSIRYQPQSSIQIEDAPLETWNLTRIRERNAPGCSNPLNTIPGRRVLSKAYNVLTAFSITSNFLEGHRHCLSHLQI